MNLNILINNNKNQFDKQFKNFLNSNLSRSILSKAMFYGSMNGGKRIRPFLVKEAANIAKISNKNTFFISAAVELIHSYSLIHDDLPCMDDDDYRRGKLSTHKKFGEATAVLAGDALHDLAFEVLSGKLLNIDPKAGLKLINNLSLCIGHNGLAAGQSLDLLFENKKLNKIDIINMYKMKTGKLFEFSFCAPFVLANASKTKINFAIEFGLLFGLIFQIVDDIIDLTGTKKQIGKTPGKDLKQGKNTLISKVGRKNIINFCNNEILNFTDKYKKHLKDEQRLTDLLYFGLNRLK